MSVAVGTTRRGRGDGRGHPRLAHLTTVDMSLALLLGPELRERVSENWKVYGISAPGPYVGVVEALGVHHVAVPSFTRSWNPRRDVRALRELASVIRSLDLDVLHVHTPKAGIAGRVLGRLLRVPVVVHTCHGLWIKPEDGRLRRSLVLAAEALAAHFSHAELYVNAEDRARMAWAVRDRGDVVGGGVDLGVFAFDQAARERVRAQWGVGPDELVVGCVGRLVEEKGVREFAAAAVALVGKARFVWIGPQDEGKTDAVRGGIEGVQLVGERSDMPAVYSALDVFVLPSHREGLTRSGMEAAACGRPMVLSDIRGCREIGQHRVELLLVPAGDAPALTGAVDRLLLDADLRERLGRAAAQRAAKAFNQRAVAAASLAAYTRVASRRGLDWWVREDREATGAARR